jgi:hypothetical protein
MREKMLPDFPKLRKEMSSHLMLKLHAMVQEKEPILADIYVELLSTKGTSLLTTN